MKAKQRKKRRATIRREDTVMVISGKDKGRTGRVITVDWRRERLLIEGVNMVTRHTKPKATLKYFQYQLLTQSQDVPLVPARL